jgi:branched-chain amino acid transport system ATP-binding protein
LLGVMQAFMPPDAFMFDTSGQLVMQTAIGGRGTLFGPLVGAAVWLLLQDFLQATLGLGAAWKLVLGVVFVLLVCFLRGGIVGGLVDLYGYLTGKHAKGRPEEARSGLTAEAEQKAAEAEIARQAAPAPLQARHAARGNGSGPILCATGLTKRYGGLVANSDIDFTVNKGELRGIIGPNGAGKSTLFNCLTGDLTSTSGKVIFEGQDITDLPPEARARLGLARSFQVPQTFESMSVLENVMIGAFLRTSHRAEAEARARAVLERVGMSRLEDLPARSLGTPGRKRLEIARALATQPKVLLLDEAMAGLTQREVQLAIDLVREIHRSGVTLVIVEHIMEVIMSLASRVVVFHQGREIARGSPREVTGNPAVIEAYLGKRAAKAAAGHTPIELMGGPAT